MEVNLEKEANKFFRKTGFNFDTYINKVVKTMLKDFAEQQVKIHCNKSNASQHRELLFEFAEWIMYEGGYMGSKKRVDYFLDSKKRK